MASVLDGLTVIDLSSGSAGPPATMLLSDHGADVIKVEPPGGDPFRGSAAYTVWNRSKRSIVIDLRTASGRQQLHELLGTADVVVDSFPPGQAAELGVDYEAWHRDHPTLVSCSITGYGTRGPSSTRPGWDALVQARSGVQWEQVGLRPGPIFLHAPLPSFGASLLAVTGISAALYVRALTGHGQHVETSLVQGALLWMTQIWTRGTTPTHALEFLWKYREPGPTPCFEGSDGKWFHPMPNAIGVALEHLGRDPGSIFFGDAYAGDARSRIAHHEQLQAIFHERPMREWVDLFQAADTPCQPVQAVEHAFSHPQVVHNGAALEVDVPGVGAVQQVGHVYHLECHDERAPVAPAPVGRDTEAVLQELATHIGARVDADGRDAPLPAHPLEGIRVLDFGTAIAGPFGPMILADLGADVIKIDNLALGPGTPSDITYAACHRGKRSIAIDLKQPEGRDIAQQLIRTADVVHYNLRTGVAERLGFGYEQVQALNPRAVFCHLTAYGNTGPLAQWPGVDQTGQAISGLEYEGGGSRAGGHPVWYRFGMCDAAAGMLSIIGVLQALLARERTGRGQAVEANILSAAMFLSSDAWIGPNSAPTRPVLDANQTGLGPLYRLYETADGWLCIVVPTNDTWLALCNALDRTDLARDERFASADARAANSDELARILEEQFCTRPADEWFARLDEAGVPVEHSRESTGYTWFDDPEARANGWAVEYPHPVWGQLRQPGHFLHFSTTPLRVEKAPPLIGAHTVEILESLGCERARIDDLHDRGVVGW